MTKQKLFEYAILYHPRRAKKDEEEGIMKKSEIVISPKLVLANDLSEVQMVAAKDVPQKFFDENQLDCVEITVRPF